MAKHFRLSVTVIEPRDITPEDPLLAEAKPLIQRLGKQPSEADL